MCRNIGNKIVDLSVFYSGFRFPSSYFNFCLLSVHIVILAIIYWRKIIN